MSATDQRAADRSNRADVRVAKEAQLRMKGANTAQLGSCLPIGIVAAALVVLPAVAVVQQLL